MVKSLSLTVSKNAYEISTLKKTSPPLKPCLINSSTTPARTSYPKKSNNLAEHSKNWYHQILAHHHARLSNSITEAMNNLIKRIKRIGYGFTNFTNYRIRYLRYAGKPN